jgi:ferredoxin
VSTPDSDHLFVCSCEQTFEPDLAALAVAASGSGPKVTRCTELCRAETGKLLATLPAARSISIACKQEEATFRALIEESGWQGEAGFVDIRNAAGWSSESAMAGPKMAALVAASRLPPPALPFISLESQGVALVYGRDEVAIEVGKRLAEALDVTVMLAKPAQVMPPRLSEFPIIRGVIRQAKGHLGAFELVVDDFAPSLPSSRASLAFGVARNGAKSTCDLLIDLSGGTPIFAGDGLRDGYLRCDPKDPVAVERLIAKARDLVGTFDKPKYVTLDESLCAHSRNRITGCTRCLEVCPTGAITPAGDRVAIDAAICAGCGGCAAVCPTGAASYALPAADDLMKRIRVMLRAYHMASGTAAVLLFHDASHGIAIIDALARFSDGLPARVIPVEVNEVTQVGIEQIAAAFAYGAAGVAFHVPAKPKHDIIPLEKTIALAENLLPPLGYAKEAAVILSTDDPDQLLAGLRAMPGGVENISSVSFLPMGGKRQVMMLAMREWQAAAPAKPGLIELPKGAPFGNVAVNAEGCTLCLACVSTCPVDALTANPDRPELRFQEDLCVQCGLCAATCPEKVITLEPRLNFAAINAPPVTKKTEEPYACDNCGKLFGTKSSIERIKQKLGEKHWMFTGQHAHRLKVIGYCEDCRIETAANEAFDPYGQSVPQRPRVKTSEDYFREREEDKKEG